VNKSIKILAVAFIVICFLVIVYTLNHDREMKVLASMIRNGDAVGISKMVKAHPKLVNANFDNGTKLKPLSLAASFGLEEVCYILIKAGADVNAKNVVGETALFFAFGGDHPNPNVFEALLQNGASVRVADQNGNTPLHFAASYCKNTNIFALLLQYGADPTVTNRFGLTPLNIVTNFDIPTNSEIAKILSESVVKTAIGTK